MTQEQFLKRLAELYDNNIKISTAKNSDYAGSNDAFKNFTLVETLTNGNVSTEMGIVTRMTDKLQRITNIIQSGTVSVKDESVLDTLSDLANYSMILRIYIESKSGEKNVNIISNPLEEQQRITSRFESSSGSMY